MGKSASRRAGKPCLFSPSSLWPCQAFGPDRTADKGANGRAGRLSGGVGRGHRRGMTWREEVARRGRKAPGLWAVLDAVLRRGALFFRDLRQSWPLMASRPSVSGVQAFRRSLRRTRALSSKKAAGRMRRRPFSRMRAAAHGGGPGAQQRQHRGVKTRWPRVALWRGRSDKARPFLTALAPLKAGEPL